MTGFVKSCKNVLFLDPVTPLQESYHKEIIQQGFPGGSVVKNPPVNTGDVVQSLTWENPTCQKQLSPCAPTTDPVSQSPEPTEPTCHSY